jgi:glycosyltransferase involved in cell wall biosynthesis
MPPVSEVMAVFAHNEANNIIKCLDSIKKSNNVETLRCFVLANGCIDRTCQLVFKYANENPFVKLVEIEKGDKANAWNMFVHSVAPNADIYFFLDGDCRVLPNSLDELERCLKNNRNANAAAALPLDIGRSTKKQIKEMISDGGLAGNLYALSKDFVERIRDKGVYLPFGLIGEDSLIGALAYWNLDPRHEWDRSKIVISEKARFTYIPLSLFSIKDLIQYFKRKKRYSIRYYQIHLLKRPLKEEGITGIPENINQLYDLFSDKLKLRWRGLDTFFDWLALRAIKTSLRKRST